MNYVTRTQWGARRPRRVNGGPMSAPSTGHWNGPKLTVGGSTSWDHSRCASLVRGVQNFHMDGRGWNDIAYNFVICPHGYVFEGRGLNVWNGANGTTSGNRSSHAIMWLVGKGNPFVSNEKRAFRDAVRFTADRTSAPDRAIGHRDHKSTECPGDERYRWIRSGMPTTSGSSTAPTSLPIVKMGDRGNVVYLIQGILKYKGKHNISVDGVFGSQTYGAVKAVQSAFGLVVDGIVGPKTWDVLNFIFKVG